MHSGAGSTHKVEVSPGPDPRRAWVAAHQEAVDQGVGAARTLPEVREVALEAYQEVVADRSRPGGPCWARVGVEGGEVLPEVAAWDR